MPMLKKTIIIAVCGFSIAPLAALAQYKDFVRKETKHKLFQVSFDKNNVSVTTYSADDSVTVIVSRQDIQAFEPQIKIAEDVIFTNEGLIFQGEKLPYENISDADVFSESDQTRITFYESTLSPSQIKKIREGNIVTFADPITVNKEDFIRGLVFSIKGLITVSGEVNKDIISLFGDIALQTGSVARGNVASITGIITVEQQVSLYGEVYSGTKDYDQKRFRFYRENEFEPGFLLNYNRVDGLLLGGKCSYVDADSTLPSAEIGLGYALESERLRYFAKLSHTIVRKYSLKVGAKYYRELASEDDWLLGNAENAVFVLLATEDFKDYYESEGFVGWLETNPTKHLELKAGYYYDDTHWLRARNRMWSLFGGGKIFRDNFSSVIEPYRSAGIDEIDSTTNGSIFFSAEYDNSDRDKGFNTSGWELFGELEWSHPNLGSDFNYRRYRLTAIRNQHLCKHSGLRMRGQFANSDGYLPMYKRYFVGGLGTLHGYRHKEFMGTRYWLTNTEYRMKLPTKFDSYLLLFWDVAQTANDAKLDDRAEIRHDLGIGLNFSGARLNMSKRLDSAQDRDLRIYVRLTKAF